jgi:pimeloyl-ACP methyl ester carboxylesterase
MRLLVILASGLLAVTVAGPLTVAAEKEAALNTAMVTLPSGIVEIADTGGNGIPVLLLHPTNIRMWQPQLIAIAKAGYRAIAVDSRNHAPGAALEEAGSGLGLKRIEEFVVKFDLPKFHVVGTALNGVLAFQYARAHPDKIRSLVMSNTQGGLRDPDMYTLEQSLRPAAFNDMPLEFRHLSATYRAANPQGVKRFLELEQQGSAAVAEAPPPPPSPPSAGPSANPDELTIAILETWLLPTMMIAGDADWYTPPSLMRLFVSHLKNGEGAVIPEAAHETYWENPEEYSRVVLQFIRKH